MNCARILLMSVLVLSAPQILGAALRVDPVASLAKRPDPDRWYWRVVAPSLGQEFVFLASPDMSEALMRIDGSDVELRRVSSHGYPGKVGDVLDATFRATGILVKTHFVVTEACPPKNDSCEILEFSATIEVSNGARSQTITGAGSVG
jgi:hypothetical protein